MRLIPILVAILLLPCFGASAQTTSGATANSTTASSAKSASGALAAAGVQSTINQYGAQLPNNTPGLAPAPIYGGTNPCLTGVSAGGSGPGIGVTLAFGRQDEGCERRNSSAMLFNMGHAAAAKELMCGDADTRAAFKRAGQPCAIDGGLVASQLPALPDPVAPGSAPAPGTNPAPARRVDINGTRQDWPKTTARTVPAWCSEAPAPNERTEDRLMRKFNCG